MSTHKPSRRIVRIAVAVTGAIAVFSGGAYALASTSAGTTASSPPHSARPGHLPGEEVMCPMIRANEPATGLCDRIGPIRACPPNAMCVRPCVIPVVVMTPAHPASPVPPKMVMHGRCVILRGVNPGGPMIPAGSGGSPGSAAGAPPAFNP